MTPTERIVLERVFTERAAKGFMYFLLENGLIAFMEQRSRSISTEPYVEHTWVIGISPRHKSEVDLAKRLKSRYCWRVQ
jgi:hypothetical protein